MHRAAAHRDGADVRTGVNVVTTVVLRCDTVGPRQPPEVTRPYQIANALNPSVTSRDRPEEYVRRLHGSRSK